MCGIGGGGGTPGVGGSIPGGLDMGIGTGGMSASTGLGSPGAGQGVGGAGNIDASLAPGFASADQGFLGEVGDFFGNLGSSGWGKIATAVGTALGLIPGAQLASAALVGGSQLLGMMPDMEISRPIPEESAETIISQSGTSESLPSISTTTTTESTTDETTEETDTSVDDYNQQLLDMYLSALSGTSSSGGRGIRGAGIAGYNEQIQQTADDWLSKYWMEV